MNKCDICGASPVSGRGLCKRHYYSERKRGTLLQRPLKDRDVVRRLREKIELTEYGCWEWRGHFRQDGYGLFWFNGRARRAHRVAFEVMKGPIGKGRVLCHLCDNRACVNPSHLFVGSRADNIRDAVQKNRHAKGEANGRSKLTVDDILAIRVAAGTAPQSELAKRFKIDQGHISDIINRKKWKHVP